MAPGPETEADRRLKQRIEEAREDRSRFAPVYNQFIDLAAPWMRRVDRGSHSNEEPRPPEEQDEIFDNTLQEAADDLASDLMDEFTPGYRPWTTHKASGEFRTSEQDRVNEFIDRRMTGLYDRIRESNFEEAAQGAYLDMTYAPAAIEIQFRPFGEPIHCEHIPISELLIEPGPFGGVGLRARERMVAVRHLDTLWPGIDWSDIAPTEEERRKRKNRIPVITGCEPVYGEAEETWREFVMAQKKIRRTRTVRGRGSCRIVAARTKISSPSAYGLGPGHKAMAPARTLDQLAYLELKRLGKVVDPPGVFDDDGVFNPDQGMDAGKYYARLPGSRVELLPPENDMREAFFKKDELQMAVKTALYQDAPIQKGDTPPTLGQWLDMKAMNSRRMVFPRARIHREWVMPLIHRFEWIMAKRGEIEDLNLDGRVVSIEPVSPLSRAADIDEVQAAQQVLDIVLSRLPDAAQAIDAPALLKNIKSKLDDDLVEVLSDEEILQKQVRLLEAADKSQASANIDA